MATLIRAAAVTAVITIAVLVGLQFVNLIPDVGAPSPSPSEMGTPSSSATPSPSPTPSATSTPTPPPGCVNPPPDITTLLNQLNDPAVAGDVVACYGNAPLTLDAQATGLGVVDCPVLVEPVWLACSARALQLVGETRKVGAPFLSVAIDPGSAVSFDEYIGTNVRVTGHFDDPAAQTCREIEPFPGESPEPVAQTIEHCRDNFVITDVVPLQP